MTPSILSPKQNLHTHTVYCDGKDTPEELVTEAIARGFASLGFSIHSYTGRNPNFTAEKTEAYKQEVRRLKEKYRGTLDIFLGIEYDIYSICPLEGYDYTLAAVHALHTEEGIKGFDVSYDAVRAYIDRYFGGDGMAFAKAYYEAAATIPQYGNFDILAHFDLVTKNNEGNRLFDSASPLYLGWAKEALHALAGKIPFFEVNTGAIARGYRTAPYPQMELLREMRELGFGAVISSDCHDRRYLDCSFDDAIALLKAAGFCCRFILTDRGFEEIAL